MRWLVLFVVLLAFLGSIAMVLGGCAGFPAGWGYGFPQPVYVTYEVESGDWPMASQISYKVHSTVRETTAVLPWDYFFTGHTGDSVLVSAKNMGGQSWLIVRIRWDHQVLVDSCYQLGDTATVVGLL